MHNSHSLANSREILWDLFSACWSDFYFLNLGTIPFVSLQALLFPLTHSFPSPDPGSTQKTLMSGWVGTAATVLECPTVEKVTQSRVPPGQAVPDKGRPAIFLVGELEGFLGSCDSSKWVFHPLVNFVSPHTFRFLPFP